MAVRRAFTLVELLVVVAIVGLLLAILLPALGGARQRARAAACSANVRSLMAAHLQYSAENRDHVVPSYNMQGVVGGAANPLDGWAPILDKHGYVRGDDTLRGHPFVCPDTQAVAGMSGVQTGSESDNPRGYMDWPAAITLAQNFATTIPQRGFLKIIRVAYWINGDNPIFRPQPILQGVHYTGSVGYGPTPSGEFLEPYRTDLFKQPSRVIALADGLYSGMQEATRLGQRDSRIGYRHPGRVGAANVGFADGHVSPVEGDRFPRKPEGTVSREMAQSENLGGGPTVYSDPQRFLLP